MHKHDTHNYKIVNITRKVKEVLIYQTKPKKSDKTKKIGEMKFEAQYITPTTNKLHSSTQVRTKDEYP